MEQEIQIESQRNWQIPWLKVLVVLAVTVIVITALLREKFVNDIQNKVSVSGRGQITYQPDIANVTLGVKVDNAADSQQALNELNQKVINIINAINKQGIAREDIATQTYSLNPHYDYNDGKSTVTGYDANQQLVIKVRDIGNNQQKVSAVLGAAQNAGSNEVRGVAYSIDDPNNLVQQAKIAAIKDAREKSQALAVAAGIKLGKVLSWRETSNNEPVPMAREFSAMSASDSKASADVPAGNKDIVVEVNVDFEVK